jgi:hypothetical protein
MRRGSACLVLLLVVALPTTAQAAQRYAAPAGEGTQCTQEKPCSLSEALGKAKANDEVIVTAGAYSLSGPTYLSFEATGAYVHGDFGGPRPKITGSVPGYLLGIFTAKSRIAHLDITNAAEFSAALVCNPEIVVERMLMISKAKGGFGAQTFGSCLLRDSVVRAEGEQSVGLLTVGESPSSPGSIRNVTAIATGPKSTGLRVANSGFIPGSNYTAFVRNSIISGEEFDLKSSPGIGPATIDVAYSNFDTFKAEPGTSIVQGGGNQAAPPLFLDAPGGDYREAPGSPTIDAGIADQLGPVDYDGNARLQGPAPDIGAFEFAPPSVPPVPAGEIIALAIAPKRFRAANFGGAVLSATKVRKAPVATKVAYDLTHPAAVAFTVERKLVGRKAGKRCVKTTRANKAKKKCPLFKPVKGGFSHTGAAGPNRFKFSGRLQKALAPGSYRMTGRTSAAARSASFRIVR